MNPCGVAPKRFSRPPRYDRFDTSPYMKLSFDRNHQIFNCFRNSFRNVLLCCCRSAEKVRCCKAFHGFCDLCARKFSRPPRYDRFDKPPYILRFSPRFRAFSTVDSAIMRNALAYSTLKLYQSRGKKSSDSVACGKSRVIGLFPQPRGSRFSPKRTEKLRRDR